jgi:hypothetical protein
LGLLAVVFALASGYRWFGFGRDTSEYLQFYNNLGATPQLTQFRFEPGFTLAAWFCKTKLGIGYAVFCALIVVSSLALKFRLLWKHTSAPVIAAIIYLMLLFPLHEYTQIRAAFAFALAYTAIDEYLDGKWVAAIMLFVMAVLFHYSAIVLAVGAALVLFVSYRPPAIVAALFIMVAAVSSFVVSAVARLLEHANVVASIYINKTFLYQTPTLYSGLNILLFLLIVCGAIFLRPWQARKDGFFFFLSFWALTSYVALFRIPVLAHRIEEAFIFSYFLFAFRFDESHQSHIPSALMVLTGGWMLYEAIILQIIVL